MPVEQARVTPPNLKSGSYRKIPAVPIFDENCRLRRMTHPNGETEVVRDCVDADRLELICRNSAARERSGNYTLIFAGHTDDEKPEYEQPPIVGYADNYRMGEMDGRPVILVDYNIDEEYYYARKLERFRAEDDATTILQSLPRRSAEIVGKMTDNAFVDAIALLKRTPFRHLGLVTHSEDGEIERFADEKIEKDNQGGIIPQKMEAARNADLITLPKDVEGTNCFNCRFVNKDNGDNIGFCDNTKVKQYVNNRNCCAYWDNSYVHRPWENDMANIDRNADNCGTGAGGFKTGNTCAAGHRGLRHKEIHGKYKESGYLDSSHEKFPVGAIEKEKFLSRFNESQLSSVYNSILKHLVEDTDSFNGSETEARKFVETTYDVATYNRGKDKDNKSILINKIIKASQTYISELAEDESGGDEDGAYPTQESEEVLNEILASAIHHSSSKDKNSMYSCSCGGTCNTCKDNNNLTDSERRIAVETFSMLKDFLLDPQYAIDRNNEGCETSEMKPHDEKKEKEEENESKLEEQNEDKLKENEEAGAASAPATPTATNGLPAMATDNPNPDEKKDNYRLMYEDQLAENIDLRKKLTAETARANKLQGELATEINRNSLSRREITLKSLRDPANGGIRLSLEKEMARVQNMNDDQFNAHVEMIKENYARSTDDDALILEGTPDLGGANPDRPDAPAKPADEPESVKIMRFAEENGIKNGAKAVAEYFKKYPATKRKAQ